MRKNTIWNLIFDKAINSKIKLNEKIEKSKSKLKYNLVGIEVSSYCFEDKGNINIIFKKKQNKIFFLSFSSLKQILHCGDL